jgi:short-subunit dehydrogenase
MNRAIVIGASSGIGKELAVVLSRNGYAVGLTGRRTDLLEELKRNLPIFQTMKSSNHRINLTRKDSGKCA